MKIEDLGIEGQNIVIDTNVIIRYITGGYDKELSDILNYILKNCQMYVPSFVLYEIQKITKGNKKAQAKVAATLKILEKKKLSVELDDLHENMLAIDIALNEHCAHPMNDEDKQQDFKFSDKCILANSMASLSNDFYIFTFDYEDFVKKLDGIIDDIKVHYFVLPSKQKKHQFMCDHCYFIKYKEI